MLKLIINDYLWLIEQSYKDINPSWVNYIKIALDFGEMRLHEMVIPRRKDFE